MDLTWGTNGSSMDRTLVRNASTLSPTTTWDSDEWIVYDADTRDYLGFHNEYLKGFKYFAISGKI